MDRPLDTERRIVTAPDGRKIDVLTAGPAADQADAHLSLTVSSLAASSTTSSTWPARSPRTIL
jgi:hypothetical protein